MKRRASEERAWRHVGGLLREHRGVGTKATHTARRQIDVTGSTLAGAMRHDLIVGALVLLAASV